MWWSTVVEVDLEQDSVCFFVASIFFLGYSYNKFLRETGIYWRGIDGVFAFDWPSHNGVF